MVGAHAHAHAQKERERQKHDPTERTAYWVAGGKGQSGERHALRVLHAFHVQEGRGPSGLGFESHTHLVAQNSISRAAKPSPHLCGHKVIHVGNTAILTKEINLKKQKHNTRQKSLTNSVTLLGMGDHTYCPST